MRWPRSSWSTPCVGCSLSYHCCYVSSYLLPSLEKKFFHSGHTRDFPYPWSFLAGCCESSLIVQYYFGSRMVTGVHCSWKYSISMCYTLFSCLTCHPPVLFLSLINRGFAALQSWKPLRLKVWGCFSFLGDVSWKSRGGRASRVCTAAAHPRAGLRRGEDFRQCSFLVLLPLGAAPGLRGHRHLWWWQGNSAAAADFSGDLWRALAGIAPRLQRHVPLLLLQLFFCVLPCAGGKGKGKEKGWGLRQHRNRWKLMNFQYVWVGWGSACPVPPDPSRFPPDTPVVALLVTLGRAAGDGVLELFP